MTSTYPLKHGQPTADKTGWLLATADQHATLQDLAEHLHYTLTPITTKEHHD